MQITADYLQAAWRGLAAKLPGAASGTFLEQTLVFGELGISAVLRVRDALPGIVVRAPGRHSFDSWEVLRLRGVYFEARIQDRDEDLFPVMLADPDAREVFAVFASDLACVVASEDSIHRRSAQLTSKIGIWKRFFHRRLTGLSEDEVRGLIGEIEILTMVIHDFGVDAALESWRGPLGDLHDFALPAFRIEAKTWTNQSLPRIHISDPSQLVVDDVWPVFLAAVQLSRDNIAGVSLPSRVVALRESMNSWQNSSFDQLLSDAGYLQSQAELYTTPYAVVETRTFRVSDGFPLIDPLTLPAGITNLRFALELRAIANFVTTFPNNRLSQ